ncbi:nitroreductase family protein [Geovibrio sp. ADMFC3]
MERIKELIQINRSYRRFDNSKELDMGFLEDLIYSARMAQSAANLQPLRYVTVTDREKTAEVYSTLGWAGYLKDWDGPEPDERPVGYIIILSTKDSSYAQVDAGLAMQNICLTAIAAGVGSCILGNIKKERLMQILEIDESLNILYVVALGYPVENVQVVSIRETADHKYFRDEEGNHYVPKRCIEDLIIKEL